MGQFIDLTGMKFSRLTVESQAPNKGERTAWNARCDCGVEITARGDHLKRGNIQSCGCLHRDWIAKGHIGSISRKHSGSGTPEYKAYKGAKDRCTNPRHENWYGRGIKFLFGSFEQFLAEVGMRPSPQHSLDRIENDGNYEPGNVRWATPTEQANNRRERKVA